MTAKAAAMLGIAIACTSPAIAQDARKGAITVSEAWSRATSPRAEVGAGFLTIRNAGRTEDRLVAATSPRAARVEIHTMALEDGIMRMRPLPNGLAIAAQAQAKLAPGGDHIMLIGLKAPLKQGERVPVTLRFARAGTVRTAFVVAAPGAAAPAGDHGGHH
jgi:copper(I)-binding protein